MAYGSHYGAHYDAGGVQITRFADTGSRIPAQTIQQSIEEVVFTIVLIVNIPSEVIFARFASNLILDSLEDARIPVAIKLKVEENRAANMQAISFDKLREFPINSQLHVSETKEVEAKVIPNKKLQKLVEKAILDLLYDE